MTEFVSNATISASIELSVFMTNYEFEPRMSFDSSTENNQASAKERILTRKSSAIIAKMRSI
jgi:hypothetical protein